MCYLRLPQYQSVFAIIKRISLSLFCFACFTGSVNIQAATDISLDLKLLVIATGSAEKDIGLDLVDDVLNQMGVPYDVLDSSQETLTAAKLSTQQRGHYNGIILTDSELFVPGNGFGFTLEEWQILHAYERDFSVREAVMSGFPAVNSAMDLDYGMTNIDSAIDFNASWLPPAGEQEFFEYVNTANPLVFLGFAFFAQPRNDNTGPLVTPLLVDQQNTNRTLLSLLKYPDGREVLLSTIANAWFFLHSQVLAYEFINYVTKGVFIGARQVFLSAHMDDVFLANNLWNTATNTTDTSLQFRLGGGDMDNSLNQLKRFVGQHRTIEQFELDLAFNGRGAQFMSQVQEQNLALLNQINRSSELKKTKQYRMAMLTQFEALPNDVAGVVEYAMLDLLVKQKEDNRNRSDKKDKDKSDEDKRKDDKRDKDNEDSDKKNKDKSAQNENDNQAIDASICSVNKAWHEPVNENQKNKEKQQQLLDAIINKKQYDQTSCIVFSMADLSNISVDITSIVNAWLQGKPNYGLIMLVTLPKDDKNRFKAIEKVKPQLRIASPVVTPNDDLTASVIRHRQNFRFINHTFTHRMMNASAGVGYPISIFEISENRKVWDALGLPNRIENEPVLVTGNHSGLSEDNNTEFDPSDDIPFPGGINPSFMQAAQDLGVRFLAADSSQPNQAVETFVPGFDIMILPRWPANLFVNTTKPEVLVDEYNYIFYERHVNAGQNPCIIPGAICEPRSYQEILEAEAEIALRHMLSYRARPHFFHQSNMRNYDGNGNTLIQDWLNAVVKTYEQYLTLSIRNPAYYEIANMTLNNFKQSQAVISGVWDLTTNRVTLSANQAITVPVTGIAGGKLYGGQRITMVTLNSTPSVLNVDRALNQ